MTIKVILKKTIKGLGEVGQFKSVADGHAFNYLFPQKLAIPATDKEVAKLSEVKTKNKAEALKLEKTAQKIIKQIDGRQIQMSAKANDKETLYKAIHEQEVAKAIKDKFKVTVYNKNIFFPKTIKTLGDHQVRVSLGDLSASIILSLKKYDDKNK